MAAISKTPEGPYLRKDIALPHWAHNPQIIKINSTYALFHIGPGDGKSKTKNCTKNSLNFNNNNNINDKFVEQSNFYSAGGSYVRSTGGSYVHTSHSPYGPWKSIALPFGCNNPAPMYDNNKNTWYLLCNNGDLPIYKSNGPELTNEWKLYSSVVCHKSRGSQSLAQNYG